MAIINGRSYSSRMPTTDSREHEASRTEDRQKDKTDEKTSVPREAVWGLVGASWPVIAVVVNWPWRKGVGLVLIVMAFIPVAVAVTRSRGGGWRLWTYAGGASAVLAVAGVLLLVLPAPRPGYADLGFSPHRQTVPFCATFQGHGSIPRGHELLIFDQGAVPGHDGTGNYALEGVARHGGGNWSISNIQLGAQNQVGHGGELTAVLVTDQIANYISNLWYSTRAAGYWESGALPAKPVSHLDYVRDLTHTAKCPS